MFHLLGTKEPVPRARLPSFLARATTVARQDTRQRTAGPRTKARETKARARKEKDSKARDPVTRKR